MGWMTRGMKLTHHKPALNDGMRVAASVRVRECVKYPLIPEVTRKLAPVFFYIVLTAQKKSV